MLYNQTIKCYKLALICLKSFAPNIYSNMIENYEPRVLRISVRGFVTGDQF